MESLGKLKPIYGTRAITAGNAPGLNDGATALLIMSKEKAKAINLEILGTIVAMTSIAIAPNRMPEGPGYAMKKELPEDLP